MRRLRHARLLGALAGVLVACAAAASLFVRGASATRAEPAPAPAPSAHHTPFTVPLDVLPSAAELPSRTLRVLVLGDSVASFLGLALRYRQDEAGAFVAARGVGECSIFEPTTRLVDGAPVETTSCSATWLRDVEELRPDVTLIILGGAFLGDQACDAAWLAAYERRLVGLVDAMRPNAGRVVLARVPYPMDRWRHSNVLDRVDCFDDMVGRAATASRGTTLDLMGHVCPTRACIVESQGAPIRPDGLHFDGVGAEETARWTLAELRRQAAR